MLSRIREGAGKVWYFFRRRPWSLLALLALTLATGAVEMANVAALYPVINFGFPEEEARGGGLDALERVVEVVPVDSPFAAACILLLVLSLVNFALKVGHTFYSRHQLRRIVAETQKALFERYAEAPFSFFVGTRQGDLIYASTSAPIGLRNVIDNTIQGAAFLVRVVFLVAFMVYLSPGVTLVLAGAGVAYFLLVRFVLRRVVYRASRRLVDEQSALNVLLNEFINGVKEIRIFREVERWRREHDERVDDVARDLVRVRVGTELPGAFLMLGTYLAIAGLGLYLSVALEGDLASALPVYGTLGLALYRLLPAVQYVGTSVLAVAEGYPGLEVVHGLLRRDFEPLDEGDRELGGIEREIAFRDVDFRFPGSDRLVLDGVTFTIEAGKTTAIVGPSGAGKSTILHLLVRLFDAAGGRVEVDGVDIRELTIDSLRAKVGYVGQSAFIRNATMEENIRFGYRDAGPDDVEEAAVKALAHPFIREMPEGYRTDAGEGGSRLSGGEKQRIAIARAVLREPELLILDEATSALDNVAARKVREAIDRIRREVTTVVVAHRLSTVTGADRIVVLDEGRVVEVGTHGELLSRGGTYAALWRAQEGPP